MAGFGGSSSYDAITVLDQSEECSPSLSDPGSPASELPYITLKVYVAAEIGV